MIVEDFISIQEQERIVTEVIQRYLIPKFIDLGMEASGLWRTSLEARGNQIWGQPYTAQLVNGRRPGKYAPIQPLQEWAQIKLGLDSRQALSVAFAVSKTLKEEGSKIYQEGGTDLLEILQSQQVLDYITQEAGRIIKQNVTLRFQREVSNAF